MQFKQITIEDKEKLDYYFNSFGYKTLETSFGAMFCYADDFDICYTELDGFLVLKSSFHRKCRVQGFPVGSGDIKSVMEALKAYFLDKYGEFELINMPVEGKEILEEIMPGEFEIIHSRNEDEYIYETKKLITLSGKKLHSKRNHLNYFEKTYDFSYEKITPDNLNEAKAYILNHIEKNSTDKVFEPNAVEKMFDNFEALGVCGGMLKTEDKIIAASVGERYNGGALIHFEKAEKDYRGAYAAINKMLLQTEFADCELVSREEDMGIEGLRKAKLSYHPVCMREKYKGSFICRK